MIDPLNPRRFDGVSPVTDEEITAWVEEAVHQVVNAHLIGERVAASSRIIRLAGQLVRERAARSHGNV